MEVLTDPREMPARYLRVGDEIAMYETDDHPGFDFVRTEYFAKGEPGWVEWFRVAEAPKLIYPPAAPDEVPPRPEARIVHQAGASWTLKPTPREFVPDEVDHVGSHRFVVRKLGAGSRSLVVHAGDRETFVIRQRVFARTPETVLALLTRAAPGTIPSWRCARKEAHTAHTWADRSHVGTKNYYGCDGQGQIAGTALGRAPVNDSWQYTRDDTEN